jgi:hypothetical protein
MVSRLPFLAKPAQTENICGSPHGSGLIWRGIIERARAFAVILRMDMRHDRRK